MTGDIGNSRVERADRGAVTQSAIRGGPMGMLQPLVIVSAFSLYSLGLEGRFQ